MTPSGLHKSIHFNQYKHPVLEFHPAIRVDRFRLHSCTLSSTMYQALQRSDFESIQTIARLHSFLKLIY